MAEIVVKLVNGELAGKTAQTIAKEANQAALALKKAEVGTKEWVAASQKLEQTKKLQADLKSQIDATKNSSDQLKAAWNKLPGAQLFNQIGQSFGLLKNGVGGLVSQFGVLKTAIASTGIGLLVLALSTLISYFTTTQEGLDKITTVTRPLKAIFEALKGVLQDVGGKLFKQLGEAIKNPTEALKDLGQILLDNVINRFKAFALFGPAISKLLKGDLTGGFKGLGNAALQAVTGIENVIDKVAKASESIVNVVDAAYQKGKLLDDLQKQIERSEINQLKRTKEIEFAVKQQKDIVEDVTKSWGDRTLAAEKALALQKLGLDIELGLLDKRIAKMKIEQSLNDTSREQQKELAELEAKKFELQARATEQGIEFKKKINELEKAQAAEQLAITQNLESLRVQALKEGVDKEISQIKLDTERKIETLKGSATQITEQKVLLEEIEAQAIQAVRDKYALEQAEKDRKSKEDQDRRDKEASEKSKQLAKDKADFERGIEEAKLNLASESFGVIAALLGEDEAARRKNAVAIKAFSVGQIVADTQREIAGYFANPASTATLGVIGTLKTIGALLRAGIAIRKVTSQKFEQGGMINGPRHSAGGVNIEAEGGEFIFSRKAVQGIGVSTLTRINNHFQVREPINPYRFEKGGFVRKVGSRIKESLTTQKAGRLDDEILAELKSINENITTLVESNDNRIDRFEVHNNLQETSKGLNTLNKLKSEADV